VVLYSPNHQDSLAAMPLDRIHHLARVWKDRYLELGARDFVRYVFVFENRGEAVGVTLHHPHGQIYAFPFIPPVAEKELAPARFHAQHGRCLQCASLADEIKDGRRIVLEGERYVATSRSTPAGLRGHSRAAGTSISWRSGARPTWRTCRRC